MVKSMTAAGSFVARRAPALSARAALVPHLGYCDEVQMDALMALRARLKPLGGPPRRRARR